MVEKIMPKFHITARETWEALVEYEFEARSEEEAQEEIETGAANYTDFEHLDREVKKIVEVDIVCERQYDLPGCKRDRNLEGLTLR
jgi:hypothetical protein